MVDMGVRKQHNVDLGRVKAQIAVHGIGLQTFALIHTAVQQDFYAFLRGEQELAAGDLFGRT